MKFENLLHLAEEKGLIFREDEAFARNQLLEALEMDAPEGEEISAEDIAGYLDILTSDAVERGVAGDSSDARERFATRLAGCLTPPPARVREMFYTLENNVGSEAATRWFYNMCRDVDYIKVHRVAQNVRYTAQSPCGELEITYNLSKPEKDPRDIAKARAAKQSGYPACMLCVENPGYAGRPGFPARQNHRLVPLSLAGEAWYLQYSPYLYYDEHCIVLCGQHVPMNMTEKTFERLFDFVDRFPHYFLGANADLPIVGGSILSHDHFQGGRHVFPMEKAPVRRPLNAPANGCVIDWPMTCLRFQSESREELEEIALRVLTAWRAYSDESLGILAREGEERHNAVTPVVRREKDGYTLYLVLRNNRTDAENPLGIFHPHADLHHIKKENIGLIEVMGLFILPGRLKTELKALYPYLTGRGELPEDSPHAEWAQEIRRAEGSQKDGEAAEETIRRWVGKTCFRVLSDCGVYKHTPEGDAGLERFLEQVGMSFVREN